MGRLTFLNDEDAEMINHSRPLQSVRCAVVGAFLSLALVIGYSTAASAAEFTPQEKANIAVVSGLFADLDAAEVRGDQSTAIVGIANKYLAKDFVQHNGNTPRDRDTWMAIFQRRGAASSSPPPNNSPPRQPATKEMAIMAEGPLVFRASHRGDSDNLIWHMFRVKDGLIVEEWQPGAGGPSAAGAPGAVPPK